MDDFLEKVKEEPIEKEYSEQFVPQIEEIIKPLTPEKTIQLVHSSVLEEKEQKPMDLFEKEIKEESEHFVKEVKEEPLDEQYFEPNVPKPCSTSTPHMPNFAREDPQNSHVNDFSRINQKRIFIQDFAAQNFTQAGFRIPILIPSIKKNAEYNSNLFQIRVMSDQSFGFSSSWKQNISAGDPVQRDTQIPASYQNPGQTSLASHTPMDNGKLKPTDDGNYDFQKMQNTNDSRNLDTTEYLRNNYDGRRCQMCWEKKNSQDIKYVTIEEEKLVLVIGYIHRNNCTPDQAEQFMSIKSTYICHTHFSDAIDTICDTLQIKNYAQIGSSSDVLMQNLMITVNILRPRIKDWEFRDILQKFVVINLKNRMNIETVSSVQKQNEYYCSICRQIEQFKDVKSVTLEDDKLVIVIGCLLRGTFNSARAQSFISRKNRIFICHDHFSDALDEIYKYLDVQNLEEIYLCSDELMQRLMIIVNLICPQVEKSKFCKILNEVALGNSSQQRKRPNTGVNQNQIKRQRNLRCAMCLEIKSQTCLKQVQLEEEKLIIMIGYILGGDNTIEEAKQFLYTKKQFFICYSHLVEVNYEIYKALQITKPEEIYLCSSELMEQLMVTVNAIDPGVTIPSFQKYLRSFAIRNKKHLSITN